MLTPLVPHAWARESHARTPGRWSDPRTWGGAVPGPRDVAVISSDVVIDRDARVAGVIVQRGGTLSFLSGRSVTLESSRNVVVRGRLNMRPKASSIVHRVIFVNVDEGRFKGEGKKVLDSDVGLWVMDKGVLDIAGSPKRAWTRTISGVRKGATTIELRDPPKGWRVGDRIVLTPTRNPAEWDHHTSFDHAKITAINGNRVKLSTPTGFGHPKVEVRPGLVLTPEVLNLSRNAKIQGTRGGRAHVFVNSSRRQSIRYAKVTHMGPRRANSERGYSQPVTGRYPLHFHQCGKGSKGSVVTGTVVTKSGNRAFVPHGSNGITFRDCVSHNTMDGAYWWDPPEDDGHAHMSNDIAWERSVASLVSQEYGDPRGRLNGFLLGAGMGNVVRDCVAVGVQKSLDANGYLWPPSAGPWVFKDNVSHNNFSHGVFNWTNRRETQFTKGLVAYHNGKTGITHGAYLSPHLYKDVTLYGNPEAAIKLWALSNDGHPVRFQNADLDGAGLSDYAVVTAKHRFPAKTPTRFERSTFRGFRKAAVHVIDDYAKTGTPDLIDFVDCTFKGNEFWLGSHVAPKTRLRVRDSARGKLTLRRIDRQGGRRRRWNARVTRG
ncbi:MAG: G8 domain-containing protein [Actinomycetota bacterium]